MSENNRIDDLQIRKNEIKKELLMALRLWSNSNDTLSNYEKLKKIVEDYDNLEDQYYEY
jgi:hypothetical protein